MFSYCPFKISFLEGFEIYSAGLVAVIIIVHMHCLIYKALSGQRNLGIPYDFINSFLQIAVIGNEVFAFNFKFYFLAYLGNNRK